MLLHIEFLSMINLRCIVLIEMSNGTHAAEVKNSDDFSGTGSAAVQLNLRSPTYIMDIVSRRDDFHTTTDAECAA